ncbi:hypothetical protein JR334_07425 [Clostridia bacterium]|nr:hypothetical protein JR334_07425 [Clostridia bacterium]
MSRMAIVQGLMDRFQDSLDIHLMFEPDYHQATDVIRRYTAKIALIEVAESGLYDMSYCLTICKELRKDAPECKLLLMCSEQNDKSVQQVVEAKWVKQIDDFVFYDVPIDYLVSKLISL